MSLAPPSHLNRRGPQNGGTCVSIPLSCLVRMAPTQPVNYGRRQDTLDPGRDLSAHDTAAIF